jgi:hypothetical protein
MDRRDAIKKLAAGGAIAAGASTVLSTNDVAFAASPPGTGLSGVPGPGESLPIDYDQNTNGTVTVGDGSTVTCVGGGTPTITYAWRIMAFRLQGGSRRFFIYNTSDVQLQQSSGSNSGGYTVCSSGCSPGYAPNSNFASVNLRKTTPSVAIDVLDDGDTYSVQVLVTWRCGSNNPVRAEYRLDGTYPAAPSVSVVSWNSP